MIEYNSERPLKMEQRLADGKTVVVPCSLLCYYTQKSCLQFCATLGEREPPELPTEIWHLILSNLPLYRAPKNVCKLWRDIFQQHVRNELKKIHKQIAAAGAVSRKSIRCQITGKSARSLFQVDFIRLFIMEAT